MRVVESAAQAAGNALGRGGLSEVESVEFGGDLGDDAGLGGKDAEGKPGEAFEGGGRDVGSDGSSDALAENLIQWELSGHE